VRTSYRAVKAGDVVTDLAATAGVTTGSVSAGIDLARFVLDGTRTAWDHIATLARRCGFLATVDADGHLSFGAPAAGSPQATFDQGVDLLDAHMSQGRAGLGAVTTTGDGAAGSQGSDAWSWVVEDSSTVSGTAGSGDPAVLIPDGALRSAEAASTSATGISALARLAERTGRLVVPGSPKVAVGGTVQVTGDAPDLAGSYLVLSVRHRLSRATGFVSILDVAVAGGVGGP
jgi:phage protein D